MENTHAWLTHEQRKIADTTYWTFGRDDKELRIHTEMETPAKADKPPGRRHSALLRVSSGTKGTVKLDLTVWVPGGSNNLERRMLRNTVASMFAVKGYDIGKGNPILSKYPGATHALPGRFIRDDVYCQYLGMVFKLRTLPKIFEKFLNTGKFR
jgi:hypothetical protein